MENVNKFSIPRCYSPSFSTADKIDLHIFANASEKAYAAVAYFRIEKGNNITTSFVIAKTRVAPLKPISVPRMEL